MDRAQMNNLPFPRQLLEPRFDNRLAYLNDAVKITDDEIPAPV
jgi:hypothetical protein